LKNSPKSEKYKKVSDPSNSTNRFQIYTYSCYPNTGYTAKTLFYQLSDEELKLIQNLASVVLASSIGMPSRATQKEITAEEELQVGLPYPSLRK